MKILSIGNSFSQDAQKYLHDIAAADDNTVYCVNLYIGGCPLEHHAKNLKSGDAEYDYEINGNSAKEKISIADALKREDWDIVTLQQVSQLAGKFDSFEPYMSEVVDAVRTAVPSAKIYFHETWAYETDSSHKGFLNYEQNQEKMYTCIHSTAKKAAEIINAGIIPVGTAIQLIRNEISEFDYKAGGLSINRDGFHLSKYGRYAAGLVWYATLTGRDITNINLDFVKDQDLQKQLIIKICGIAQKAVSAFKTEGVNK